MFEDKDDAGKSEKEGKQFKFVDKRKFAKDSAENENNAPPDSEESNAANQNNPNIHKTESADGESADNAAGMDESAKMPQFEADFATFVYSLNTQALLFLGKIPNPATGKYEKNIDMAKYLIDTIDMLSKKTKGNLDENEGKLVENILYDLRMAFISEKR